MMSRQFFAVLTLILLLGIGAYALGTTLFGNSLLGTNSTGAALAEASAPAVCEPLADRPGRTVLPLNARATDFNLPLYKSDLSPQTAKTIQLASFLGKKPVLLEFFATWCPHCQHSIAGMKSVQKAFGNQIQIIAVNAGDDPATGSTTGLFQRSFGITYPIAEKPTSQTIEKFCLSGFPTFYLVNPQGQIAWRYVGILEGIPLEALKGKIQGMVKPTPKMTPSKTNPKKS